MVMPASIKAMLEKSGNGAFQVPGLIIGVEDSDWPLVMDGSRTGFNVPPPQLPTNAIELLQLFIGIIENLLGHVGVRQGRPETSQQSGRSIIALQSASEAPVAMKAKHLRMSMERLGMIELDTLIRFLPEHTWRRILGQYDAGVVTAIVGRIKSCKWDIRFTIPGENAMSQETQSANAMALAERGKIDTLTLHEILKLVPDPQKVLQRLREEQQLGTPNAGMTPGDMGRMAPPPPTTPVGQSQEPATQMQQNTPVQKPQLSEAEKAI